MGLLRVVLVAAVLGCVGARLRPKTSPLQAIMQDDAKVGPSAFRTVTSCFSFVTGPASGAVCAHGIRVFEKRSQGNPGPIRGAPRTPAGRRSLARDPLPRPGRIGAGMRNRQKLRWGFLGRVDTVVIVLTQSFASSRMELFQGVDLVGNLGELVRGSCADVLV